MNFVCDIDDNGRYKPNEQEANIFNQVMFTQFIQYFHDFITSPQMQLKLKQKYLEALSDDSKMTMNQWKFPVTTRSKTFQNPSLKQNHSHVNNKNNIENNKDSNNDSLTMSIENMYDMNDEDAFPENEIIQQNMNNEWKELSQFFTSFGESCNEDTECTDPLKCVANEEVDSSQKTCLHSDKSFLYSYCLNSDDCYSGNCLHHQNEKFYCAPKNQTTF